MFPISDDNPTLRTPVMTILLLVATWAVWFFVQGGGAPLPLAVSVCDLGFVPGEVSRLAPLGLGVPLGVVDGQPLACVVDNQPVNWLTPVLSMFLHGSWGHILGNSLYLTSSYTILRCRRYESCSTTWLQLHEENRTSITVRV